MVVVTVILVMMFTWNGLKLKARSVTRRMVCRWTKMSAAAAADLCCAYFIAEDSDFVAQESGSEEALE